MVKKIARFYIPLLLMLAMASCKVSDPTKTKNWLMISEGGGITGAFIQYYMLPNGNIYRREHTDTVYIKLYPMPGRIARGYFRDLPAVFLNTGDKPMPDNISKSLVWQKNGEQKGLLWYYPSDRSDKADEFYNFLLREMHEYNPTASR